MQSNAIDAGTAGNGTGIAGVNSNGRGLAINGLTSAINEALPGGSTTPPGGAGPLGRLAISFMTRDTDAKFAISTAQIIAGMNGNKAFPASTPPLSEVIAARTAYTEAITAGLDSRLGRSQREKARKALVALLRPLAHYVEDTCAGDRALLISSGFPLQRERGPIGPLPAPIQVRLVKGKTSGTAIARCRRLDRARGYQWRIAPAATPTAWSAVITTFSAHAEFEALATMSVYVVQVCAVGTAGTGNWSETAAALVL